MHSIGEKSRKSLMVPGLPPSLSLCLSLFFLLSGHHISYSFAEPQPFRQSVRQVQVASTKKKPNVATPHISWVPLDCIDTCFFFSLSLSSPLFTCCFSEQNIKLALIGPTSFSWLAAE
ncbi:hypothetical protein M441DRAFT_362082 [Trichoderma asperellum CBS 433.97]|uniref:Uncharacterized protein n=1 Tax=Trichoderma asperellum (strain ATCC 204424 / CBS 433.97 / NBRC 101777) TaxID=1042311 RepID=A0A2T3ZDQ9_TRIA4|nr:hypothetical protein M441DRAFT_362082 [Trichoderma asperellum CBS 433.97]PTB42939.1 hypothetical protein M441DRAFT_362082 [Trichoderma asperellum CBS 433.97]